ncbi:MAG: baseplate J/ family protein [Clostridia bacterium]|jgi:phage-related baseplate assembly protein|nr:baseplate J/ family protein [Clostridia bacterium]
MSDDVQFVEVDSVVIQNQLISDFESILGETLYPGDERRIFLLQLVPLIVGLKNDINNTGKQNLLRYASGAVLDALGDFYDTIRLPAQKSSVTLRFTLSSIQAASVTVPQGTRVTPDGIIYFSTTSDLVIAAGQTTGDITAESIESGVKYNGFVPGQIKNIVDPVAYVASVTNIDESSGGADVEDDESYRERIRLAPESYSVAGPEGAYVYWAKTADSTIADVSITSPTPGVVKIVPLLVEGGIPNQAILDKVYESCNATTRRPLTDNVQVAAPTQVTYNIELIYYISTLRQADEVSIKKAVEDPGGAIDQYIIWQREKLGRAINPDELRYKIMQTMASRIVLTSPQYLILNTDEVAVPGTVTITYGGLE